jgi:hypothetical protein
VREFGGWPDRFAFTNADEKLEGVRQNSVWNR